MSEEGKVAAVEPTAKTESEKLYPQKALDEITEKIRARHAKEIKAKDDELEQLRLKALTGEEKQREEFKREGAKDAESRLAAEQRRWAIERKLMAKGVSEERLDRVSRMVDPTIEDAAAAVEALAKEVPEVFSTSTKNKAPGADGRGSIQSEDGEITPEQINKWLASGEYWKHAEQIRVWRQRKFGGSGSIGTIAKKG